MKKNILILSSLGMHLKPLASRLRGIKHLEDSSGNVSRAEIKGHVIFLGELGQGQKQAAQNCEKLIDAYNPDKIFYLGLAGALRQDIKVPSVFCLSRIKNSPKESSEITVKEAIALQPVFDDSSPPLVTQAKGNSRVFRGTMLSVESFTGGFRERKRLKKTGLELLDIEAGAVAEAVAGRGISFTCLVSVSDDTMEKFPLYQNNESGKPINPPPRKVIKALEAAKALGSVSHMWLMRYCLK